MFIASHSKANIAPPKIRHSMPPRPSIISCCRPLFLSSIQYSAGYPTKRFFSKMASPPPDTRPIVISGPSGVGKGTLYKMLFERHPATFTLSVSHTTRSPRPGEQDGVDYHYVPMDQFEGLIAEDGFVEHAKFGGNRYGTSKMTIEEQQKKGKVVLLDIEMEGVKQIKKSTISARYVFIAPPSVAELEKRLRGRGTEKEENIIKRLDQAEKELEYSKTPGVHDIIIVNDDLERSYREFEDFVYRPAAQ